MRQSMNDYCCFQVHNKPDDYLNRERIERIWTGLLAEPSPAHAVSMHVCPMHIMHCHAVVGSSLFVAPNRAGEIRRGTPGDPPAPHGQRIYNWWELDKPNIMPQLTLTYRPVPESPAKAAAALSENTGEELSWHVPNMPSFFNSRDTLVLIPVELDFQVTPRKTALAWEWMDKFLLRAGGQEAPSPGLPANGPVDIMGSTYHYRHESLPAPYRVERLMSLYPEAKVFYGPQEEDTMQCPKCGELLEIEELFASLPGHGEKITAENLRLTTSCCDVKLPFNSFPINWLGFTKFCLQTLALECADEDIAELSTLMDAPFKAVFTHI